MTRAFDGAAHERAQVTDHPGESGPDDGSDHNFPIGLEPDALCRTCGIRADAPWRPCVAPAPSGFLVLNHGPAKAPESVSPELAERARAVGLERRDGLYRHGPCWILNCDSRVWPATGGGFWAHDAIYDDAHTRLDADPRAPYPSEPAALLFGALAEPPRRSIRLALPGKAESPQECALRLGFWKASGATASPDWHYPPGVVEPGESSLAVWRGPLAGGWHYGLPGSPTGSSSPTEDEALTKVCDWLERRAHADAVLAALVPPAPVGRVSPVSPSAAPAPTAEPEATPAPAAGGREGGRPESVREPIHPGQWRRIEAAGFVPGTCNVVSWLVAQAETAKHLRTEVGALKAARDEARTERTALESALADARHAQKAAEQEADHLRTQVKRLKSRETALVVLALTGGVR